FPGVHHRGGQPVHLLRAHAGRRTRRGGPVSKPAPLLRRLTGSSTLTFLVYPVVVLAFELALHGGLLRFSPGFLLVMAWGYAQYRLCGRYRIRLGGGGPGMDTPPERLVTTGPFALSRNPMYMGHIIFLAGLALALHSWLAAALAGVT